MRLWLKLVVLVGLGAGVQWWLERDADWLDDALFTVRCGYMTLCGAEAPTEDMLATADRLRGREADRYLVAAAR